MRTLVALFAATACMSALAGVQSGNDDDQSMTSMEKKFDQLDRDKDSQLSKSEAQQDETLSAEFASVDQDGDGYISKSEYSARLSGSESKDSSWRQKEPMQREPY